MSMSLPLVAFYLMAILAIGSALAMVLARDVVHGVLFMIGNFVLTAAFYIMLQAPFIAAVQLIVYAGAIMVLFLFVVMLLGASEMGLDEPLASQRPLGLLLMLALGIMLTLAVAGGVPAATDGGPTIAELPSAKLVAGDGLSEAGRHNGEWISSEEVEALRLAGAIDMAAAGYPGPDQVAIDDLGGFGSPQMVGEALFTEPYHLLPFELVSLLLLVAMMGAVVIARFPHAKDAKIDPEGGATADDGSEASGAALATKHSGGAA
jgi:NADH-quinone oxidoreductase subunit J